MKNFITIFHSVQEIVPFSLFLEFGARQSSDLPMINVILQSLGLGLVNINVYAKVYQHIPNGLRVVDIFRKLSGDKQLHKLTRDGQV